MQKTVIHMNAEPREFSVRINSKPLVGDNVDITVLDEKELEGSVTEIHKRKNSLIRPAVANVDQALVIFAMDNPKPNFMLLDRFLIMMEREGVPAVICFNKKDLATTEELEFLYETYQSCGYQVILSSALKREGLDEIEEVLQGMTTVVAGHPAWENLLLQIPFRKKWRWKPVRSAVS